MNRFESFVPYKFVTLEKLVFGLDVKISIEAPIDYAENYIGYQIRGYVWSQDAGKKVEFKYPADWWEAFKERWFPEWLSKRYPVRYTHKEFRVKATYPELNIRSHEPIMRLIQSEWTDLRYE